MLHEFKLIGSTYKEFIKPHANFLDLTSDKEQIEWSEILMQKHPELFKFHTAVRNSIKSVNGTYASVYTLASARTFLTCRYIVESTNKAFAIEPIEIKDYMHAVVNELQAFLLQQPHDPLTDPQVLARTHFFKHGAFTPSTVSWMENFFNANSDLAVNFLLPENSYPPESERFMYRGILDIAYPIESAVQKKASSLVVDRNYSLI